MTNKGRDARLALIAQRQGGVFSFDQALGAGFPRATISRRLATGAWSRVVPGVLAIGGMARTRLSELWVASLAVGPGGVVSHESAALVHGAERLPLQPITMTARHGGHRRIPGVLVHQIDDLAPWHVMSWRGLRLSSPARCIVELGATRDAETVGRVADDLVGSRRTTFAAVAGVLANVARPGKPGIGVVARMLVQRDGGGPAASGSELERALHGAIAAGGLPPLERQVPLPGRGIHGVADGAYRDAQMVVEVDGRRWHARLEAMRADRERDARVVRAGWVPLRFVYEQVIEHPGDVCDIVDDTRRMRLALLRCTPA